MSEQEIHNTLVNVEQLQAHFQDRQWVVFDCRFDLMNKGAGQRVYQAGHIPGAFYLHLEEDLSSEITPDSGRHPLPDPQRLAQKLCGLGVNQDSQVVAYDDIGGAMAARAWWLLRWMGHEAVAVLDGGLQAWQQRGLDLQQAVPQVTDKGDFQIPPHALQADQTLDAEEILQGQGWQLVDARAPERFRGELEPIDPVAGHIPGAVNRPLTANLWAGYFKSAYVLQQEWSDLLAGRDPQTVVHYCGSGVTACHNQLAMEIAGFTGSRIYPGSWSGWIRDPERVVVVGG